MNNRKRKRLKHKWKQGSKHDRVMEIIRLCIAINSFEERHYPQTGVLPTVFFDFSGHVAWLTVWIYPHGYKENSSEQAEKYLCYLDELSYDPSQLEKLILRLTELRDSVMDNV